MRGYHQLIPAQRYTIYCLKNEKYSQRKIARIIDVHPSTVNRELNRNTGGRGYRYKQAQIITEQRRSNAKKHIILDWLMKLYINERIKQYESPEQIVGVAKLMSVTIVSTECIYKYICKDKKEGGTLYKYLRSSKKKA